MFGGKDDRSEKKKKKHLHCRERYGRRGASYFPASAEKSRRRSRSRRKRKKKKTEEDRSEGKGRSVRVHTCPPKSAPGHLLCARSHMSAQLVRWPVCVHTCPYPCPSNGHRDTGRLAPNPNLRRTQLSKPPFLFFFFSYSVF